ncbi:cache domain-containing protein [Actinocorallia sp. B10E7]|uniref:cache domain-containing protein n=1 Tax=Actinocorallia sp. B10E7 TaxID=3153558 RepID=UPI00325E9FDF
MTIVDRIQALADHVFGTLDEVRDATARLAATTDGGLRSTDLARLRPLLFERLGPLIAGLGFIALPGLLPDSAWYLEWWQYDPDGPPKQLAAELDPAQPTFYDYTQWAWFTHPQNGLERSICGPYVDYLCTDEYSLTFSVPVLVGGAFVGVAAADVFVRTFETTLLPALKELPGQTFVTNNEGRVIASNTARWISGSVFRGSPAHTTQPIGRTGLSLVTAR